MVNFFLIARCMIKDWKDLQKEKMKKKYCMSYKKVQDKETYPQKYQRMTDEEVEILKKQFEAKMEERRAAKEAEEQENEEKSAEEEIDAELQFGNIEDQGFSAREQDDSVRSDVKLIGDVISPNKATKPPLTTGKGNDSTRHKMRQQSLLIQPSEGTNDDEQQLDQE